MGSYIHIYIYIGKGEGEEKGKEKEKGFLLAGPKNMIPRPGYWAVKGKLAIARACFAGTLDGPPGRGVKKPRPASKSKQKGKARRRLKRKLFLLF